MAAPIMHAGDTGPLIVNVKDSGAAVNLTGATVLAKVIHPNNDVKTPTINITNAAAGETTVTLASDTLVEGTCLLQIKITFADRIKTTKAIALVVERKVSGL